MDDKLRRVENASTRLERTVKTTFGEEISLINATAEVTAWLTERGLGEGSKMACIELVLKRLKQADYHPATCMQLLNALTAEQIKDIAEDGAKNACFGAI